MAGISINTVLPNTQIYTDTLTSKITITAVNNVYVVALLYVSGTVTVKGSNYLLGNPSTAIGLSSSNPSLVIGGTQQPIDGLVIDASGGNCQIICYF